MLILAEKAKIRSLVVHEWYWEVVHEWYWEVVHEWYWEVVHEWYWEVVLGVGRAEGPWTLVIEWDGQRDLAESSGMSECQGTVVVTAGSLWAQYGQGSRQLTK